MQGLTRTSALRGVLLHIACIVCITGAVPVPVLDPLPEINYDTPRGVMTPRTPGSDVVDPERRQYTDWTAVAVGPDRSRTEGVAAPIQGVRVDDMLFGNEGAPACHHCQDGRLRLTEHAKEAEVQRAMCSSDFAIGGRVVGSNNTHYRMQVFAVFKSGPKPIYGMMSYRNPRSSTLRPPPASSSSASLATSTASRAIQPGESGEQDTADDLEPPREFVILKDVVATADEAATASATDDGTVAPPPAPQCQPCPMRLGRNYFVAGLVRDDAFLLSADSTVFRWKRKVRQFVEAAVRADDC